MHDQPNSVDSRVGQLDAAVERLTSEVSALKLELATLISALREIQDQRHSPRRPIVAAARTKAEAPSRPSPAPAAVVVLLGTALLSWQLITSPHLDRRAQAPAGSTVIAGNHLGVDTRLAGPASKPIQISETEPPVTPLVAPTVYKGSLAITAAQPGARVFVNRQDIGVAPVRLHNLKAGAHLVWIESEGYRRWTRVVTVPAQRLTRVSATLEPLEPPIER